MFLNKVRFIASLLLIATLLATGVTSLAQTNDAQVRFVHAIPGASAVDIYINGQLTATNLEFGSATSYIMVPAAQHQITVTPVGATTALWQQVYTPAAGKAFTLVASSFADPITFTPFEDLLVPLGLGKARFAAIHAIADAPPVDIVLEDGRPVLLQQSYDQAGGTLDIPVFAYNLAVVPSGGAVADALLTLDGTPLNTGVSYMLLLYGTAANPQYNLLSTATAPETGDAGFVKLVHAVPGAPTVDVYAVGETETLLASLTEPDGGANTTPYIALPAGDYDLELRASGSSDALLNASATVSAGVYNTVVARSADDAITLDLLTDDISDIGADEARIRVINASADTISASLADGSILANNLAAGAADDITSSSPASQSFILAGSSGMNTLPEQSFYGGSFYDIVILDGGMLSVAENALAQTIGSAPGAGEMPLVAAVEPTLPPTPEPIAVQPTPVPAAPVEPTPLPPTAAPPVAIPTDGLPTGRVFNLNVDANLQLRQYPSSDALSLGTVPFGTILTVNGREGALEEIFISATQVPPDYEYVDPVGALEDERDDLEPSETWLNVTYNTPDGGTIEAWVRADFIDVRDAGGQRIPLRELETVAGNRPGEARDTDITPPPVPEEIVTLIVINLDQGANLNVRRTPDTSAEVLAQLPLGATAEFLGLGPEGEWVLLRFTSGDGLITTGWSSTSFVQYSYRGRDIDLAEMEERGLLVEADITERGSQTVGAAPVIAPTIDPTIDAIIAQVVLDPGANLNLRRQPDVNAEVLAQIPSGTRLIVSERTADARWLNVTYEGVAGWVAAQTDSAVFVALSFNGAPFEIADVPVVAE